MFSLCFKKGQLYETIADVHPINCDNVTSNAVESDDTSPKVSKVPFNVCEITGNESQAKEDKGNLKAIPAEGTRFKVLIKEDDPVSITQTIPEEKEHKTPDQDKAKENLSDYEELDECRREVEDPHVYQKLVKARVV